MNYSFMHIRKKTDADAGVGKTVILKWNWSLIKI